MEPRVPSGNVCLLERGTQEKGGTNHYAASLYRFAYTYVE